MAGLGAVLEGDAESVLRLPRPPLAVPAPPAKLVATLGVRGFLEIHRVFLKYARVVGELTGTPRSTGCLTSHCP